MTTPEKKSDIATDTTPATTPATRVNTRKHAINQAIDTKAVTGVDAFSQAEDFSKLTELCFDSLERVTQLVDHIELAISITNTSGEIEYCNESFSKITGYSLDELAGKNPSLLSYKTTPATVYKELWATITAGNIWQGRLINKRKNTERYLAEIKIVPLRDKDNKIKFFMGMQKDISDSHIIKEQHSNQSKTISAILNTMPSALALINSKQQVLLDNLAYKTLASDYQQEPATLFIEQIKQQHNIKTDKNLVALSRSSHQRINIAIGTDNHQRWFTCRLLALEVSDIDIDSYFKPQTSDLLLLTITECTQEKIRAERQRVAELQTMTAETEMVHAMQETMQAVLHQLHAPVNMIESAANLINQESEDRADTNTGTNSGLSYAMNLALTAGNEALTQLRNALPERSAEAMQLTNVNQVIHDLSQISTHKLLQNSIELTLNLKATLPNITAQPSRLRVAFKKLLDNAIDTIVFNKCGVREIEIKTYFEGNGVKVVFEDSGIGIPKEQRYKVFQPFYSTKPYAMEGTRGIGLSIVQQTINEHSGTIEIKDSSLGGTRVCVFLPKL